MKKVIDFPKSKIVRDTSVPIPELEEMKLKGKQNFADSIVAELVANLHVELENYGVDTEAPTFNKDFIFLMDVLKSVIYRNMKLEHGLHQFIDKTVKIYTRTEDDEMVLMDEAEGQETSNTAEIKWNSYFKESAED